MTTTSNNSILYKYSHIRTAIKELLLFYQKQDPRLSMTYIADKTNIQRSHLSRFLNDRGLITTDQLYLICRLLSAPADLEKYLFLLLEMERTGLSERKQLLEKEARLIRENKLKPIEDINPKRRISREDKLSLNKYYLNPKIHITHMILTIKRFAENPDLLSQVLQLGRQEYQEILTYLSDLQFIKIENGKIKMLQDFLHLEDTHELCDAHQALMKMKSNEKTQSLSRDRKTQFCATFTADPAAQSLIQEKINALIKEVSQVVAKATSENAYQMNIDFFSWI